MKCVDWFIDADTHITEPGESGHRVCRKSIKTRPRA